MNPRCDGIIDPQGIFLSSRECKPSAPEGSSPTQTHSRDLKTTRLVHPVLEPLGARLRAGSGVWEQMGDPNCRRPCVCSLRSDFLCGSSVETPFPPWMIPSSFSNPEAHPEPRASTRTSTWREGLTKAMTLESHAFGSNSSCNIF